MNDIEQAVNPAHYKGHPSGVEAIDIIENMPFNLGTACKYLLRLGKKDNALQELKKAEWYLTREKDKQGVPPSKEYWARTEGQNLFVGWCSGMEHEISDADYVVSYVVKKMGFYPNAEIADVALRHVINMICDYETSI